MNDMGFMDRESKKRQLRRNIVQPPQEERPSRYEEEDSEEVIRQVHRERRKKRILTTVMTVLFLAVTGFCFYKYQSEYEYTGYDVAWERPMRYTGAENSAENAPEAGENGTPENGDPEAANAPEGAGEDDGQPPQITPSKSVSESKTSIGVDEKLSGDAPYQEQICGL